jgi:hypothetical protein
MPVDTLPETTDAREAQMAKAKTDIITAVREGYSFEGACVELGALIVDGEPRADAKVRVPLAMLQSARPGRRCHGDRQDQDVAVDG